MKVDLDILCAEFQYNLWATRSKHQVTGLVPQHCPWSGLAGWDRMSNADDWERTVLPAQKPQKQEPGNEGWIGMSEQQFPRITRPLG